ncbi:MAG: hypothetical protein MK097_06505, partial [Dechloromonas sp.]|nr:hypothetical protein [Dechloromonas sp.]
MFNLSRYFSTVSFILIVLAAGVLGPLYQKLSLQQMKDLAQGRNVAMAQVFQNSLHEPLLDLLAESTGRDASALAQSRSRAHIQDSAEILMQGTSVIRVKVYNRVGNVIFSTDARQIGENRLASPGFKQAINGSVFSELTYRNTHESFDEAFAEMDVLASYIPIRGKDNAVEGGFELYQNVTPFVEELERSLWWVTAGIILTFALLYLMQFLVVRRAQGILEDQEGRIKAARDTLELQVAARTEELKRTNVQLEGEISERRQAQSKLNYLAYHDPLTGLANRWQLENRLGQM